MAVKTRDVHTLEKELSARADAEFEVEWLDEDQLRSRWDLVGLAIRTCSAIMRSSKWPSAVAVSTDVPSRGIQVQLASRKGAIIARCHGAGQVWSVRHRL